MSGWQTLWTWALGVSVVLFFVVEGVVVVGGAAGGSGTSVLPQEAARSASTKKARVVFRIPPFPIRVEEGSVTPVPPRPCIAGAQKMEG